MAACLFCDILAGEVPSEKVAEDDRTYAFRDINPVAPVHVLVIPKEHIEDLAAVRPGHAELLSACIRMVQQVAESEGVLESGFRTVVNKGGDAGMEVAHLHLHVIGGRRLSWPPG